MNQAGISILLVDDEPDILEFLSYNLLNEGYTVLTASNGSEALKLVNLHKPTLIILDVMMPGMDGVETCKEIRKMQGIGNPLISFLTARNEDFAQIAGLEAGADDYITKPIKPKVFISRVKAILRRLDITSDQKAQLTFGELKIWPEKHLVSIGNEFLEFPRKEFDLLCLLSSKPGKVFHRDEILNSVWGSDVIVGDRTIDVHIRKLRAKLGDQFIKTIKGVGYKFEF